MTEILYYVAASLDGFLATHDGGVDWLLPFQEGGEDHGFSALLDSVGALLLGSRTYEQALGFGDWPTPDLPSWVFSSRGLAPVHPSITVTRQSPREVVAGLDARGVGRAWLMGGSALAGSFRAEGLISETIVSVIPVILGGGIPLFAPGPPTESLRLVGSTAYPSGIVQLRYSHPGRVKT